MDLVFDQQRAAVNLFAEASEWGVGVTTNRFVNADALDDEDMPDGVVQSSAWSPGPSGFSFEVLPYSPGGYGDSPYGSSEYGD